MSSRPQPTTYAPVGSRYRDVLPVFKAQSSEIRFVDRSKYEQQSEKEREGCVVVPETMAWKRLEHVNDAGTPEYRIVFFGKWWTPQTPSGKVTYYETPSYETAHNASYTTTPCGVIAQTWTLEDGSEWVWRLPMIA